MRRAEISQSKVVFKLVLMCLFVGILCTTAIAQERTGTLNGVAVDSSGAVVPGVAVTITNKESGRAMTATTGGDGTYIIRSIDPGRYTVKFEREGFSLTEFPDINVLVGQTLKLDPKMKVGAVSAEVQVTDVVPLIDTQARWLRIIFRLKNSTGCRRRAHSNRWPTRRLQ